ncbi:hypothetical protein AB3M80_20210 [Arthrospira platensis BEA 1257B]
MSLGFHPTEGFVGWVSPNRRLCRLGETQQQVRDGVFGLRPATEPPAWVAPYDYGKEAGRGERFNTTAEKAIALGSRWAIAQPGGSQDRIK